MKRIIKIFALILLILSVFGITTSRANDYEYVNSSTSLGQWDETPETVYESTTPAQMREWLKTSNLTGISNQVRDKSFYLLCRERYWYLSSEAQYELVGNPETFDTTTPYDISDEYAKAYILAAPGYVKNDTSYGDINTADERQYAWYCINGESDSVYNDLYHIAIAYQKYKLDDEKDVVVTVGTNAKTEMVGANVIYGPIKVEYSYKKGEGTSRSDEWGGFNYAFFDEDNTNISNNVQLCIKETNGTYTPITSSKITSGDNTNGYYKVRENTYNNKNLYVVTNDNTISSLSIKIQENVVDYKATIYSIKGEYYKASEKIVYCSTCSSKTTNAKTSEADAISAGVGTLLIKNGNYYKYDGIETKEVAEKVKNVYRVGSTDTDIGGEYATKIKGGGWLKKIYKFSAWSPCGKDMGEKVSDCGTSLPKGYYHSQGLHIIETASETKSNELELDMEIQLRASIEIIKEWQDYNNQYQLRPSNISLNVYRRTNQSNWKLLTSGTDYNLSDWTKNGNTWTTLISGLERIDSNGDIYYFKVEEVALNYYNVTYSRTSVSANDENRQVTITNELKHVDIDVTKNWEDYSNAYELRPNAIDFNVFRRTDENNWEKLTKNTHYKVAWTKNGNTWNASITELLGVNSQGQPYFFKVEEQEATYYKNPAAQIVKYEETNLANKQLTFTNYLKDIDISGVVWEDGDTGVKPAVTPDGLLKNETKMKDIVVYLYYEDPINKTTSKIAETKTDENGNYKFEKYEIGYYYVQFVYDGINYEDTITGGDSKAFETDNVRNTFNGRFNTITNGKSNDGTTLEYTYADNKSSLITKENDSITNKEVVKEDFKMYAQTKKELLKTDIKIEEKDFSLSLGLIKRATDIALSTDVYNAEVKINGQTTNYTYNKDANTIEIGATQTNQNVNYNLNLYASDYNYRMRDYVSNSAFSEENYVNGENPPAGVKTGDELDVYVTYELNLQNQTENDVTVKQVLYRFDEKYTSSKITYGENTLTSSDYSVTNNIITINKPFELTDGETKTLYLEFKVNETDKAVNLGDYSNKAEITSYSTAEGLIDTDSQPGNFLTGDQVEDDNDTAGGLTIKLAENTERKITGKVFDKDNNQNINDVIVQLIELKTVGGKTYEYIWQETVSGTGEGKRLNGAGTALEEYTYTKNDGTYEFKGFIPGDYIVRFIYGDGATYNVTGNVIKYNGQDYKSITDTNYKSEWYNSSSYTADASVARDNEARRLETMAYSVEIDAKKGVLLKLLDYRRLSQLTDEEKTEKVEEFNSRCTNESDYITVAELTDERLINLFLNETEKETLKTECGITEITADSLETLLKDEVLKNTWMCAETSKIKIAVDVNAENVNNTTTPTTTVNGINTTYVNEIPNINLGLEQRPATKIELKKYITGFKLVASNGQTLVNAYIDVDEYIDNTADSNKVQGVKDNMITILGTVWQYEVIPTEINTIVDGASLEFEYTLVVQNTGETDYLSTDLAEEYNNSSTAGYITFLGNKVGEIKTSMKNGTYSDQIGNSVGNSYYAGGTNGAKVKTEVTNIRDYINNDLRFITSGGNVAVDETFSNKTHRILRDDYTMQDATIKTILKTTEATGKMENNGEVRIYNITLGKNPISSTGNLSFENYIAEVMSYTNAAGRRTLDSTPGNAEIIDHEHRKGKTHEKDEADTARIQIGVATGEDEKTNYTIIMAVIAGIAVIAAGAFVVKKYVIK